MTRARLNQVAQLIPAAEKWNPLECSGPAPEYIPPAWDGPHVGLRLVQAFSTLARLPGLIIPGYGAAWPEYAYEFGDLTDHDQYDRERDAAVQNRTRLMPDAGAISRMEAAIVWPARYVNDTAMRRIVQRVAMLRAREVPLHAIARRLKRSAKGVRNENRKGLDTIAAGLRRDDCPIF
ncbi:DUF6362 family protein [Bradyrhizobium paxllaeri]|uniref:DUF6362 family protein n=1 Tax=Bradyrhizobium paxllaeri TaxID=190148 RepID=UPI000810670A|nr:DUF6362 family protein [Bradyrhizobium paxllaeri]